MFSYYKNRSPALLLLFALSACAAQPADDDAFLELDEMEANPHEFLPLEGLDDESPPDESLPSEIGKADAPLPTRFNLLSTMSAVRNQGSRGSCVSFTISALAEHFHRKLNLLATPDFSEQYLYWLTHGRGDSDVRRRGGYLTDAMDAFENDGIPVEAYWPYQSTYWNRSNNAACVERSGGQMPAYCLTNGQPSTEALTAAKYFLGSSRSVRRQVEEIKSYMAVHHDPVAVTVKYARSVWNATSTYRLGYVPLPSSPSRIALDGGHSVLVVGWDDSIRIPRVTITGEPELDRAGNPVVDVGVFIIRNSWGTTGWGSQNPTRAGYGYLSYRYFDYLVSGARVSEAPSVRAGASEICNNRIDDDRNGVADCADSSCVFTSACAPEGQSSATFVGPLAIRDSAATPTVIPLALDGDGPIESLSLLLDLAHTYVGDLEIKLVHPSGPSAVLWNRRGGSARTIDETFDTDAFNGLSPRGTWRLIVTDMAAGSSGTVSSAALVASRCVGTCPFDHGVVTYRRAATVVIPDDSTTGAALDLDIPAGGTLIYDMWVQFRITHPVPKDLRVVLERVGGPQVEVVPLGTATDVSAMSVRIPAAHFSDFNPVARWRLVVYDRAARDVGQITYFGLIMNRI